MSLNNQRFIMKRKTYIAPVCENFNMSPKINFMLTLSVSKEETEIVGANETDYFEEEKNISTPSSLWDEE